MAYPPVDSRAPRAFLADIAGRREFRAALDTSAGAAAPAPALGWPGFGGRESALLVSGLRLTGAQTFVRNFASPDTDYSRLLIKWQTGAGKSIAAIAIAQEFAAQYRRRAELGERAPAITILGFTTRETILEDMLQFPEFGFASAAEIEELRRLRAAAAAAAAANSGTTAAVRHLAGFLGVLRRRITDRARGGYYQFFGYKEFANRLFRVTRSAAARGFDADALFARRTRARNVLSSKLSARAPFGERLAEAVRRGDIEVDAHLLEAMRGGLLVCDEIHNVYNILEPNNYGAAIQYALDALGEGAPRVVLMSATPVTGSAAEVVDLLNLLVPRSALPGGAPLRRADFFLRTRGAARLAAHLRAARLAAPAAPAAKASANAKDSDSDSESEDSESDDSESDANDPVAASEFVDSRLAISKLLPGALDRISRLAAGRVSFLLDADVSAYPVRKFEGVLLPNIPYVRFTPCELSPLHARTLAREQEMVAGRVAAAQAAAGHPAGARGVADAEAEAVRGLAPVAYSLNDMVFPAPPGAGDYGLYRSDTTIPLIAAAPAEWRQRVGVEIVPGRGSKRGLGGAWLQKDNLATYSAKYSRLLSDLIGLLRAPASTGKVMVYHHRVHMSGVLLLAEVLRANGFVDELGEATDGTLCVDCGRPRAQHAPEAPARAGETPARAGETPARAGETHTFAAARFALAHSDIDRAEMLRSIARFNSPANLDGRLCKVLLGSKIVREGLNFKAVRHLFVASMPTDYPTLMQVFGRVVRKNSHAALPPGERTVAIRVYVGTLGAPGAAARLTPELQRYSDKGQEFLVIQAVERCLHIGAVDGFVNFPRVQAALAALPAALAAEPEIVASIDGLPYAPLLAPAEARALPVTMATFDAYGHGPRLVQATAAVCRALFAARPVWTYEDLWAAVRAGAARGPGAHASAHTEESLAAALERLSRPAVWGQSNIGGRPVRVARAGRFYIATPVDGSFAGVAGLASSNSNANSNSQTRAAAEDLDVEAWLRQPPLRPRVAHVSVPLGAYVRASRAGAIFDVHLKEFEARYLQGERPLELALLEVGGAFHVELLRRLIASSTSNSNSTSKSKSNSKSSVTSDDARVADLYRRFRIGVTAAAAAAAKHPVRAQNANSHSKNALVGYATTDTVVLYDAGATGAEARWRQAPPADFGVGRRHRENDIVVGFVVSDAGAASAKFKLRPPLQRLRGASAAKTDNRKIERGAVCETRPREELDGYARRLRAALAAAGRPLRAAATGGAELLAGETHFGEPPASENYWPDRDPIEIFTNMGFAAKFDRAAAKRFPSAGELCEAIRLHLLELEERARAAPDGMARGARWVYLFADRPPNVASKA